MQNFKPGNCIESHHVLALEKQIRLQDYGFTVFVSIKTKSALKKAIKKGLLFLDGRVAETSDWIEEGQVLELFAEELLYKKKVFPLQLKVIFEDDSMAVVNKPEGYPTNGNYFKTIENALTYNLKTSSEKDKLPYPQPVHRLDNPTSGLLIIAKTLSSKSYLSVLFEHNKVHKIYLAIVEGHFEGLSDIISLDIDGKQSSTNYGVEKMFKINQDEFSLLSLKPSSGRTHQLRIHLSKIGHPIVGDKTYGSLTLSNKLMLHASSLELRHPKTDKSLSFETEVPHKFVKFINRSL
ncbi:ribosomal large subunit pseudouridine synthase RluA [Psychroflexus torquis ATCC 700755]|uniref:Ribosomal large subunit pseudouridine synthase RluA n=1 Tax=Psychroflexus torquis (strain ATCC 700755 / CIP 106069 / ACAM 623) TaxID=313595 RepID=K4IHE1_PSYTT|nr:RluA family pseudouridine synthase [Psychroflexus torquis]AFU69223.1 ribosomal large subunit pseudouridine synthase RluA [Psychroflexus torquis ATCC 700755]